MKVFLPAKYRIRIVTGMIKKMLPIICALFVLLCGTALADSAIVWNGHVYKLFSVNVTWETAKAECERAGGHLVTIGSPAEQEFIRIQIMNHRGEVFWIGLTDEREENVWFWVNGEDVRYTNWGPDEPDNTGDQDHVCIHSMPQVWDHGAAVIGHWDDDSYGVLHGYICEWETADR